MNYPIITGGRETGLLRTYREGLFTVYEAENEYRETLLRLSVFGGGEEAVLGLMEPRQGKLYLRKKLSDAAQKNFPDKIEYAGEAGKVQREKDEKPGTAADWKRLSDGSLRAASDAGFVLALPVKLRGGDRAGLRLREIEGKEYILFFY